MANVIVSKRTRSSGVALTGSNAPRIPALAYRTLVIVIVTGAYLIPAALFAVGIAILTGQQAAKCYLCRRAVVLLQRLGPAFIKGGQILGTRRDVLPRILCDELCVLQDSVAPLSSAQARTALKAAYGTTLDIVFSHIDYRPVASGSIACVYRGRLHSGQDVAIKLQRPDIAKIMAADLRLITKAASFVAQLRPFQGIPVRDVLDHLCQAVHAQLDFPREAEHLKLLRENLSAVPRVWVPRLMIDASRSQAVVMEFIPGLDLRAPQRCSTAVRKKFAASALTAIYQMLFIDGFVHCDLHPGNLYFTERGQVVILDAGFSVQLSDHIRRLFAEFFLNMSLGRGRHCAEIVIESSTGMHDDVDLEGFSLHMADLVERNSGLPARDFSLIAFATEMFDLQRKFGLHAATELLFPLLALLVIEGTIRDLDPDIDFQKVAKPILTRGVFGVGGAK